MTYLLVRWLHEFTDEPILLYSEMDADRYETRKVEVFRGGRVGVAGEGVAHDKTRLGIVPVPPIEEIAADPEFTPREISRDEFEAIWLLALRVAGSTSQC